MHHRHNPDRPRRQPPAILPYVNLTGLLPIGSGCVRILNDNPKHLAKVLSETVGGGSLDSAPRGGDESLYGSRVQSSGELLFFGFDAGDDGHGEEFFVHAAVEIEDLADFGVGFGLG